MEQHLPQTLKATFPNLAIFVNEATRCTVMNYTGISAKMLSEALFSETKMFQSHFHSGL